MDIIMLKVMIVDDEPLIRQGLRSLITWEEYGFEICEEASGAQEGLEKTAELSPDLIIVDIKMPKMSGLDMISELKKSGFKGKIIILSGYSDFHYAQKAIELGVSSYILKPIDEGELITKITDIRNNILETNKAIERINDSIKHTKHKALEKLVIGGIIDQNEKGANDIFDVGFPWSSYQVILAEIQNIEQSRLELELVQINEIEALIEKSKYGAVFVKGNIICILVKNRIITEDCTVLSMMKNELERITQRSAVITVGKNVSALSEITDSYQSALSLLNNKFIFGPDKVILWRSEPHMSLKDQTLFRVGWDEDTVMGKLYLAVDVNSMERINDTLEEYMTKFMDGSYTAEDIKIKYMNLYSALINQIILSNPNLEGMIRIEGEVLAGINQSSSLLRLNGYFKYVLTSISDRLINERPDGSMKKILDCIHRNCHMQIKLSDLADMFNYNSAYLGKLFKKYVGDSFNTYLDKVRIEKAKALLESGYKVKEVAEMAGYSDISYFFNKFKKYTGVSPSSYKCRIDKDI